MTETLPVRLWPDSSLSTPCLPYVTEEFNDDLMNFVANLKSTLSLHNGFGLAAPQVGIGRSVVVFNHEELSLPEVMINPRIVSNGLESESKEEGCLSLPGIYGLVERYSSIEVTWQDITGVQQTQEVTGLPARVIQHELDHLNGVMFFHRMSRQMRRDVLRRWDKHIK